jgi:hypothetical protein
MREIIFRSWVNDHYENSVPVNKNGKYSKCVSTGFALQYDPSYKEFDVEQYTGLLDGTKWEKLTDAERSAWLASGKTKAEWNGKMIFEGDVVKIKDTSRILGKKYTCNSKVEIIQGHPYVWPHPVVDGKQIRFGAMLLMHGSPKYAREYTVATDEVIVICNIHENPELSQEANNV